MTVTAYIIARLHALADAEDAIGAEHPPGSSTRFFHAIRSTAFREAATIAATIGKDDPDMPSINPSPDEIAATLINGNISDARRGIITGQTQHSAAVLTLDVITELVGVHDMTHADAIAKVRRCITQGRDT